MVDTPDWATALIVVGGSIFICVAAEAFLLYRGRCCPQNHPNIPPNQRPPPFSLSLPLNLVQPPLPPDPVTLNLNAGSPPALSSLSLSYTDP
jgi:hypothetical protein